MSDYKCILASVFTYSYKMRRLTILTSKPAQKLLSYNLDEELRWAEVYMPCFGVLCLYTYSCMYVRTYVIMYMYIEVQQHLYIQ